MAYSDPTYKPKNIFANPITSNTKNFSGHRPRNLLAHEDKKQEAPQYKDIASLLGGLAVGGAQGIGDLAANVAQAPGDALQYLFGHGGYKIEHPNWKQYTPDSEYGRGGEEAGEVLGQLGASPALGPELAAGKALYSGRMIPRLISSALGGAAQAPSGERLEGGTIGLAAPAVGKVLREAYLTPKSIYGATKRLNKANILGEQRAIDTLSPSVDVLNRLDYLMESSKLKPARQALNLKIADATRGGYKGYRDLQSDIGDVVRDIRYPSKGQGSGLIDTIKGFLSQPRTTAQERLLASELEKLRKIYKGETAEKLIKGGHQDIASLEARGDQDYARYKKLEPYIKGAGWTTAAALGIPGAKMLKKFVYD